MKLIVIDCGTTNCRMRLVDGDTVAASVTRQIGAKDVAIAGSTLPLERALKESYEQLRHERPEEMAEVEGLLASGMITSNAGLYELPHLDGPVDLEALARGMKPVAFPELCDKPIVFVPGIRFVSEEVAACDMLRGEETEVYGYLGHTASPEAVREAQLIMHYGSHHKWIKLEQQQVVSCRTSVTGELFMAVAGQTLLKSSLVTLDEVQPEQEWVSKGIEAVETYGAGHALFAVRTLEVLSKQSKQAATSFMLGIMIALDLAMLTEELLQGVSRIVLYGRSLYPSLAAPVLQQRYPQLSVEVVPEEESALLSVYGASMLYKRYKEVTEG
ncbi:2-dehydro-3-deoxygalactonokinase [Paenibacillus sp. YYML68]|uniref:2-dehydro-3-deoxygalactonokinase n=1 Tax=Paenibacillus sp. YYML68 TaxID=2909250 RepID=UPI002493A8D7|nr:2-dehydro-3-deoxygalactonokinase [Paenibacillus sp. YYML68]